MKTKIIGIAILMLVTTVTVTAQVKFGIRGGINGSRMKSDKVILTPNPTLESNYRITVPNYMMVGISENGDKTVIDKPENVSLNEPKPEKPLVNKTVHEAKMKISPWIIGTGFVVVSIIVILAVAKLAIKKKKKEKETLNESEIDEERT